MMKDWAGLVEQRDADFGFIVSFPSPTVFCIRFFKHFGIIHLIPHGS
jgi:hypothetical protein